MILCQTVFFSVLSVSSVSSVVASKPQHPLCPRAALVS